MPISAAIFGTGPTLFRAPFTFLHAAAFSPRRSIVIFASHGGDKITDHRFRVKFGNFALIVHVLYASLCFHKAKERCNLLWGRALLWKAEKSVFSSQTWQALSTVSRRRQMMVSSLVASSRSFVLLLPVFYVNWAVLPMFSSGYKIWYISKAW